MRTKERRRIVDRGGREGASLIVVNVEEVGLDLIGEGDA